jgi:protein involved in polysaccharide export with SLBB domain
MSYKIIGLLIFLFFASIVSFAQIEQEAAQKLHQEGINSYTDVQAELKKRNMTEDEAREMAKQYGMDYDTFIKEYITGGKDLSIPTTAQPQTVKKQTDTINVKEEKAAEIIKPVEKKVEQKIEKAVDQTQGKDAIEFFGYKMFKDIPAAFEPNEVGPIDPGYLIGPGDVLRLYIWGAVEFQYELTVDAQGTIFIPTAGQVFVSGTAYSDLQRKLTIYLSKFYQGLNTNPPTTFLDISLAKLKPIRIFAMGEVNKPGGYSISSFATVFNALYSIGGPVESGSLREIRVLRNNKVISKVDLYDYLLNGKLIGDLRLQNNDMIFVPKRQKTVTIKGEVLRQAVFELKDGEGIRKLIEFAGDLKATAYTGRVQINRIKPFQEREKFTLEREVIDVNLADILRNKGTDFPLYDGDIVTVFPILDKVENYVTISGSVYRPGTYELSKVPKISNLISEAYGVLPEAYYGKADIIRTRPDESFEFFTVDLGEALKGNSGEDIELKPRDQVKIYSIYELIDRKSVSISGYVKNPVTLEYADSLKLFDMVFRAGGLQDPFFRGKAFTLRADVIRVNPDGYTTRIIPFDLEKVLRDKTSNLKLEPGDKIFIYKGDVDKVLDKYVTIEGEVKNPGRYPINSNMTPMDLILQAGGFTEMSLRTEVNINRLRPSGYSGEQLSENISVPLPIDFLREKSTDANPLDPAKVSSNFTLEHKDIVMVRKNPNYEAQRVIRIFGEVKYPGTYVLGKRNENLLEILDRAGGPTSEGYLFGMRFNRGGKRLVVNADQLYYEKDLDNNVLLQNGDSIYVPLKPNTVLVTGEVNNPGLQKYLAGDDVKDYIKRAGGSTKDADYIIYHQPNGESDRIGFGIFRSNPEVFDGSIINVTKVPPKEPDQKGEPLSTTIKDVLAIVVSAVTVVVLAAQLK